MNQSALTRPILVLNKGWTPIDSTTVRDAFCNVMSERAFFIDPVSYMAHNITDWMRQSIPEGEFFIQAASARVRIPEIMILSGYSKVPVRKVVFCRRNLWRRDRQRCQYCGVEPPLDEITIDHILPKSKGGESIFSNCVLACIACNLKKGNRLLTQTGMRLRRMNRLRSGGWTTVYYDVPKRPVWNPLYALRRKTFPKSWGAFLRNFDEALYWEVELET